MERVMDVLGVVDYVVDHLDFIMRSGPMICKRPTIDADGDINIVDAVDCDRSCCVGDPHRALVIPEIVTAMLEPLEDDPLTLRSAMCVSHTWASVGLDVYLRRWMTTGYSLMRIPDNRQSFFASRLRHLTYDVYCLRSSPDLVGTGGAAPADATLTRPHTTGCHLMQSPSLVFSQLRELELSLHLDEYHADVLTSFLARCGRQLATVRILAPKSFGKNAWAAAIRQLAQLKRLRHIGLRQKNVLQTPGSANGLAELSRGVELVETTVSSEMSRRSADGRGVTLDNFRKLYSFELHPLLPFAVERLPLLLSGCSLMSLTVTVARARFLMGDVGGASSHDSDFSASLRALAQIRSLRELRVRFSGNGRFSAEAFMALKSLVNLELLVLAPADERPVTGGGEWLFMNGISSLELPRWKAAVLPRLTVLELLPDTFSGSAVLTCISAACPQLEELVIEGTSLWMATNLSDLKIIDLPRLRRLRFVQRNFHIRGPREQRVANAKILREALQKDVPWLPYAEIYEGGLLSYVRLNGSKLPGYDYEA